MLFDSWGDLGAVLAVGTLAYAALVLILRISGKRTLSKMNAFDFVVTVALGSTLASTILSAETALAEGVLALALLIGLQYAITWLSVRTTWFEELVKSTPTLVFYRGEFLDEAMQRQRVTTAEVRSAIRKSGMAQMDEVEAVVLETDGSFTVLDGLAAGEKHGALANVEGAEERPGIHEGETQGPIAR
jgi:uncharacterized membrane protein YcaP (DUF421 family)